MIEGRYRRPELGYNLALEIEKSMKRFIKKDKFNLKVF